MDPFVPPGFLPPDVLLQRTGQALLKDGWLEQTTPEEQPTPEEQGFLAREADWQRRDKVSRASRAGTGSGPPQPAPAPLAPEIVAKVAAIRKERARREEERGRREEERRGQHLHVVTALRVALCTGAISALILLPTGSMVEIPADFWRGDGAPVAFIPGPVTIGRHTGRVLFVLAEAETWLATQRQPAAGPEPGPLGENVHSEDAMPEQKCRQLLVKLMSGGSNQRAPKADYLALAVKHADVSKRGFDRVWGLAITETGNNNWGQSGPKPSRLDETDAAVWCAEFSAGATNAANKPEKQQKP